LKYLSLNSVCIRLAVDFFLIIFLIFFCLIACAVAGLPRCVI